MSEASWELESRFLKLTISSIMKTIEAVHADIDAHETVRQHMLGICAGVRQRALDAAPDDVSPSEATAAVDALIKIIDEYIDYSSSPMFPAIELIHRSAD